MRKVWMAQLPDNFRNTRSEYYVTKKKGKKHIDFGPIKMDTLDSQRRTNLLDEWNAYIDYVIKLVQKGLILLSAGTILYAIFGGDPPSVEETHKLSKLTEASNYQESIGASNTGMSASQVINTDILNG